MKISNTLFYFLFILFFGYNISAKSIPEQIFCPDDITISCCQDYNNLDITGDPAKNNLQFNYFTKVDSVGIDECREGLIKRIWTGHNALGSFDCTQYITMERTNQFSGNINWPNDWAGNCGDDIPYSEPEYDIGFCDQIGHTFKDDTFRFVEGACVKILRNWRVIDWCIYEPNSGSNNGIIEHTQVFMIVDNQTPEINECSDRTISALNQNCTANFSLTKTASDNNCGNDSPLKWVYEIDLNNDWNIDSTGTINEQTAILDLYQVPVGTHKIKWKVFDGCANVETCMETITVIDGKPPTLFCYLSTTYNLMQNEGEADTLRYAAKNFVKDAYDNCTDKENIIFSYTSDPKDSVRSFTCWDLGFQFLRIFAIDEAGNSDFTSVLVRIGINGSCSFNSISGSVTNMANQPIEGINIGLQGNGHLYLIDKTNNSGQFSFPYKESEIKPKIKFISGKNTSPQIDMNDIKITIDYLLGKTSLDDYQMFSADVNNDNKVSIADIRLMKQLLLGKVKYDEISNPARFFIRDLSTTTGYKEIEYIEELNDNIEIKCVLKGEVSIK